MRRRELKHVPCAGRRLERVDSSCGAELILRARTNSGGADANHIAWFHGFERAQHIWYESRQIVNVGCWGLKHHH
jgi:hypothetical protein